MTLCLRRQDLDWREIDEEIVALDGQDAVYLSVRGAGALVWRLLADSTSRGQIVDAIVQRYGIDSSRAGGDVDAFLTQLGERGLLAS